MSARQGLLVISIERWAIWPTQCPSQSVAGGRKENKAVMRTERVTENVNTVGGRKKEMVAGVKPMLDLKTKYNEKFGIIRVVLDALTVQEIVVGL